METPTIKPRPITCEEFKAGEEFQLADPLDGTFKYESAGTLGSYINKANKGFYCAIYTIEKDGFRFIEICFNHKFIHKVYFKDCFILKKTT